ncbi:MAG: DNA replication/repair protein RecF [Flavobacteriales bacterium]|nr:DNA replication/repair protein RecF [Flavobacteriales bacterium]
MKLISLDLLNFKNYEQAEFLFKAQINCFTGNNGSGKTNILDAIHYLSFCKSHFNAIDVQNIKHGTEFFVIEGKFDMDDETDQVFCSVKKGQGKTFKRNKKSYEKLADHIGKYPSVIITPYDIELVKGGSELRRKFIDKIISQYDRPYLDNLIKYNRSLSHRNNLLKFFSENRTFDQDQLNIWNDQLVEHGNYIYRKRRDFISELSPMFTELYKTISGSEENVSVEYRSQLNQGNFYELLVACQQDDRRRNYSTVGLHKDDLLLKIGEHPIKKFGSQGQQKSLLIALRLAQFQFIKEVKGVVPILLLDDIFDKLDDQRVKNLIELVSEEEFGQIFISDTSDLRMIQIFEEIGKEYEIFKVSKGELSHENIA